MEIKKRQIKYNITALKREKFKYIVMHDTNNFTYKADANMHFNYFNSYRNASADYFVDDKNIIQTNDIHNFYSWHCGDGYNRNGISNRNSIGVEICVNQDSNYDIAFTKTIELVKHLSSRLDIKYANVVRHFDASGKICPYSMSSNNWEQWRIFKKLLYADKETIRLNPDTFLLYGDTGYTVRLLQRRLNQIGLRLEVDGIFGYKTERAVKEYQTKNNLYIDGIVGRNTTKHLMG